MVDPTPDGYVRVCVSTRRGKAHLLPRGKILTVCGALIFHSDRQTEEIAEKRKLCRKCKRGALIRP